MQDGSKDLLVALVWRLACLVIHADGIALDGGQSRPNIRPKDRDTGHLERVPCQAIS